VKLGYLALELRRVLREPGTLLFVIGFPGGFYLLEAVIYESQWPQGSTVDPGTVLLPAMAGWGVLISGMLIGSRVVNERAAGWQRQLRLTPLSGGGYLLGKIAVGMVLSIPPPVVVALVAAVARGVRLDLAGWLFVTLGISIAGVPFALLGLFIGQVANTKNIEQIIIVGMVMLAIFGGIFIPIDALPRWFVYIGWATPSYWLTELGRVGIEMGRTPVLASVMLLAWTVVLAVAVMWRFRHDSARD
jgi:ABC-2 type transport system permease protein